MTVFELEVLTSSCVSRPAPRIQLPRQMKLRGHANLRSLGPECIFGASRVHRLPGAGVFLHSLGPQRWTKNVGDLRCVVGCQGIVCVCRVLERGKPESDCEPEQYLTISLSRRAGPKPTQTATTSYDPMRSAFSTLANRLGPTRLAGASRGDHCTVAQRSSVFIARRGLASSLCHLCENLHPVRRCDLPSSWLRTAFRLLQSCWTAGGVYVR